MRAFRLPWHRLGQAAFDQADEVVDDNGRRQVAARVADRCVQTRTLPGRQVGGPGARHRFRPSSTMASGMGRP